MKNTRDIILIKLQYIITKLYTHTVQIKVGWSPIVHFVELKNWIVGWGSNNYVSITFVSPKMFKGHKGQI